MNLNANPSAPPVRSTKWREICTMASDIATVASAKNTLRMRGVFFALATVAMSLAMVQISRHFVDLTGGADGLALRFIGDSWWAFQSRTPAPFLYGALIVVIVYYAI